MKLLRTRTSNRRSSTRNHLAPMGAWFGAFVLILSATLAPAAAWAAPQAESPSSVIATADPVTTNPRSTGAPASLPGLTIEPDAGGMAFRWEPTARAAGVDIDSLPKNPYNGYLLPMQTTLVEWGEANSADTTAAAALNIQQVRSTAWQGELETAPQQHPPAIGWEPNPGRRVDEAPQLPTSPLFIVSEATYRGRRMAGVAFSPIYQDPATGEVRYTESLNATISGAQPASLGDAVAAPEEAARFAPVSSLAANSAPTNQWANRAAVKLNVTQAGMQEVSAAAIADAGLPNPDTDTLQLWFKGSQTPLHIIDNNSNGRLNDGDAIRFYAPRGQDTWNETLIYWLVQGDGSGARMVTRSAQQPDGAPQRTTALEPGRFEDNTLFESTMPGHDGDNWFHADLDTQPDDDPAADAGISLALDHDLPLATSAGAPDAELTFYMTVYRSVSDILTATHRLSVEFGGATQTDGDNDWPVGFVQSTERDLSRTFTFAGPFAGAADDVQFTLLEEDNRRTLKLNYVDYLLPAQLNFNGKGGIFQGVDGDWRYQITNTAGDRAVYDITDPAAPQRLAVPSGADFALQDGPEARRYLLTGEGALFTPTAVAHDPMTFNTSGAAHTLYIAPEPFMDELDPLVQLRRDQGYTVRVVDVQEIYDAWGYGMVDPEAIRSFLRFAVGNWNPAPIAAVLVGDGTWDPHDYLGHDNDNHMPPYLADVDPYIHVTACDNCFGQLDGDDPTSERAMLPDIWIGRFPVNDEASLVDVVNKIVGYETASDSEALWRRASLQLADDYIKPTGAIDSAGNFPALVESIIEEYPAHMDIIRHYFGAFQDFSNLTGTEQSFFETLLPYMEGNVSRMRSRTLDIMNGGVGLVTYTGHSNHWQWSITDPSQTGGDNFSARIFGLYDAGQLHNRDELFIALSMTCYTAQFPKPADTPTTLDEDLFLRTGGGAVAVWGSSGLSVADGHDTLQRGFYDVMWDAPAMQAKLGALTLGGYAQVAAQGVHLDVNRTYLLLGDPLTSARVQPLAALRMPSVVRMLSDSSNPSDPSETGAPATLHIPSLLHETP